MIRLRFKPRSAFLYGTLVFAAYLFLALLLVSVFTSNFYTTNLLDPGNFHRYRMTLLGIAIIFIPVGIFFSYLIGYLLSLSASKADKAEEVFSSSSRLAEGDGHLFFTSMDSVPDTIERIKETFEQIQQFSVNASHELRTPLTIIRGEIELALRSPKTTEDYQRTLTSILEEVHRLSRVQDDLLLIAKTQLGQISIEKQEIALHTMVEEIADEADVFTAQAGIDFMKGAIEPAWIMGDPLRIRRVFLNLIDNAVKYNTPRGSVMLSMRVEEDFALVCIRDTGIGIPPESLVKIFDRFYRVPSTAEHLRDSTGLGLYIVKWIVESHGGEVLVESALGKGSEFIVKLPLA